MKRISFTRKVKGDVAMVKGYRDGVYYFMKSSHFEDLAWFAEIVDWYVYV